MFLIMIDCLSSLKIGRALIDTENLDNISHENKDNCYNNYIKLI